MITDGKIKSFKRFYRIGDVWVDLKTNQKFSSLEEISKKFSLFQKPCKMTAGKF